MNAQIENDARAFGAFARSSGWLFGLYVARSVRPGESNGRPPRNWADRATFEGKVSAREFARMAGTSKGRVLRFLQAWEKAADAELVPYAAELLPGDEHELPDDSVTPWSQFYSSPKTTVDTVRQNKPAVRKAIQDDPEFAAAAAEALAEHRPAAAERALSQRAERRRDEQQDRATNRAMERGDAPAGWDRSEREEQLAGGPALAVGYLLAQAQARVHEAAELVKEQGAGPDDGETIVAAISRLRAVLDDFEVLVETGDAERFDAALAALTEGGDR